MNTIHSCSSCGESREGHFSRNGRYLYSKCNDCKAGKYLERRARNLARVRLVNRRAEIQRTYGISLEEYEGMIELQAGLCACCTEPMKPGNRTHLDHCHATGRLRGFVCNNCNRKLAPLEDQAFMLYSNSYLSTYSGAPS